ncbi:hypothetical protein [Saccharothrix sp. HUAS TT1]|uniref:hypothetical protein n=1 Tax=unclassified Saccharothrix TaxID=2593673 RepID=UPI00345B786E
MNDLNPDDEPANLYVDTLGNSVPETGQEHYEQSMRLLHDAPASGDTTNMLIASLVHMVGALAKHHGADRPDGPYLA